MHINASGRKFSVDVEKEETVHALKLKVMDEMGIPPQHQKINFGGKTLSDDSASLSSFGIESSSEVNNNSHTDNNIFLLLFLCLFFFYKCLLFLCIVGSYPSHAWRMWMRVLWMWVQV